MILLIFLNLKSSSQKDTNNIILDKEIAKLVIKDLVSGDGCKLELEQTYIKINKLQEKEIQKDTIIHFLNEKISNYDTIINDKNNQITEYKNLSKDLENELKSNNNKLGWFKAGTIAGGVCFLFLLIVI